MAEISKVSDERIVAQIVAGNLDLYGQLMMRYEQKLLRYVIYLIHDSSKADDVVQDTFIKTYQNLNGFNPKYKFSSWIYRIAHNEAMNAIKKDRHIMRDLDVEEIREASYESNIIRDIDRAILRGNIKACLDEIDNKYREVLMLLFYENMKYSEIADILHVPISTVGVRAKRAKIKLKQICEQKGLRNE